MKLIHTSDWHFGMGVGTGNYEEDQRFFLQQLYDLIRKEQVEAVPENSLKIMSWNVGRFAAGASLEACADSVFAYIKTT